METDEQNESEKQFERYHAVAGKTYEENQDEKVGKATSLMVFVFKLHYFQTNLQTN